MHHRGLVLGQRLATRASAPRVFDESAKALQKQRAALAIDSSEFDYLRDEFASRLVSRVGDVKRTFDVAVDLGCGSGHLRRAISADVAASDAVRGELIELDHYNECAGKMCDNLTLALPLDDDSADVVLSSWWLHWANDLGGLLRDATRVLKPDGLFLACLPGAGTLHELRVCLQTAEMQIRGGIAARVSPFVRPRDMGGVLGAAGLTLTTVDTDRLVVRYKDMNAIMKHLRGAGENNAVVGREPLRRDVINAAAEEYEKRFTHPQGGVTATFEIVHLIGWKPASGQPEPLERGAGISLTELVGSKGDV